MTIEGLQGIIDAFDENVHKARGYKEQVEVASRIRDILHDSKLTTKQGELRTGCVFTSLYSASTRCSWQVLNYVKEKLEIEMNAATDNPLIFEKVISGGNFHGQPIAFAMDS